MLFRSGPVSAFVFVVVIVSFLPNILSFLFRYLGIPTISGLLNLSYAIDSDSFLWPQCGEYV